MSAASRKGTIGNLTGDGDEPGLNPAICAITPRGHHEGHGVIGIRGGWAGLTDLVRDAESQLEPASHNRNNSDAVTF